MLLSALLEKIEYRGELFDCEISHVTNNSREAHALSVFVCIRGFSADGHKYALSAYSGGCRAFVCEYRPENLPPDASVILVEDTRVALASLSCALYEDPSSKLLTIGITGTKGKTTTALMIKQLLCMAGIPAGYIGSNGIIYGNNSIQSTNTTPESYKLQFYMNEMLKSGMRAVVMEVSSQALKLNRVLGVKFDVTMFTNLSPDHIGPGEHENFEDYFNTKKKLFDDFDAPIVIANADDEHSQRILTDCSAKKIFYSINKGTDYSASGIELCRDTDVLGVKFICNAEGRALPCTISVPGDFNVQNALSAIAAVHCAGVGLDTIISNLSSLKMDGRFEVIASPNGACFVIDYAHNGISLSSALNALRKYEPSRLICLFGSVGERTQVRRTQLGSVASREADISIITSDNPGFEDPSTIIREIASCYGADDEPVCIVDRAEAIRYAFNIARDGDIVLLAGKGHERYQLINGKKDYFCEREILEDCIKGMELIAAKESDL